MLINETTIDKVMANIKDLLTTYLKEVNVSLDENGGVDISLPVKIRQNGQKLEVQVGIGFVKTKVKDAVVFVVDDQPGLFDGDEIGGGTRMDHM